MAALLWLFFQPDWLAPRNAMVDEQIRARGVTHQGVLRVMRETPRHEFIPGPARSRAYADSPVSIGYGATISQPFIVAKMTELLQLSPSSRVLEVGTGSGYQAAILSLLAAEVFTIEIVPELARSARATLDRLGHRNVHVRQGDGYKGWPEEAPFDRIILTAAPPRIPEALVDQLKPGGILVAPEGRRFQELVVIDKHRSGTRRRTIFPVQFVPMEPAR